VPAQHPLLVRDFSGTWVSVVVAVEDLYLQQLSLQQQVPARVLMDGVYDLQLQMKIGAGADRQMLVGIHATHKRKLCALHFFQERLQAS